MKNGVIKVTAYAIPIIILALAIFIMTMQPTRMEKQQFAHHIQGMETHIKAEEWDNALNELQGLEEVFYQVRPRIQFSLERGEINDIELSFARIKGYLKAKDEAGALVSTLEARLHWLHLDH